MINLKSGLNKWTDCCILSSFEVHFPLRGAVDFISKSNLKLIKLWHLSYAFSNLSTNFFLWMHLPGSFFLSCICWTYVWRWISLHPIHLHFLFQTDLKCLFLRVSRWVIEDAVSPESFTSFRVLSRSISPMRMDSPCVRWFCEPRHINVIVLEVCLLFDSIVISSRDGKTKTEEGSFILQSIFFHSLTQSPCLVQRIRCSIHSIEDTLDPVITVLFSTEPNLSLNSRVNQKRIASWSVLVLCCHTWVRVYGPEMIIRRGRRERRERGNKGSPESEGSYYRLRRSYATQRISQAR